MRDPIIDLSADQLLPVNVIVKRRLNKRVSPATIWRWRLRGVNGATLECIKVGNHWCTTDAAFSEFLRAQQPPGNR